MGDFYELFYEDVKKVVKLFDIILIVCGQFGGKVILMVGIFFYFVEGYLVKLVKFGELVVICEQIGDLVISKGLVECQVVWIIIFGMVSDEVLFDECCDNLLVVIFGDECLFGFVVLDIISGCFSVQEIKGWEILLVELECFNLVELLIFDDWLQGLLVEKCCGVCCCVLWDFDCDLVYKSFCQ